MDCESSEGSYSEEQYFLDLCRAGELGELKEWIEGGTQAPLQFATVSQSFDNFFHILGANNLVEMFDYLYPLALSKLEKAAVMELVNAQNSTRNTPLHYAVITASKDMVQRLLEVGADTAVKNQFGRTPFDEAEQFDKMDIAEILAPVTKQDIEQMRVEMGDLVVCGEEDSDSEEEG